ncbi:hypothetical protein PIB30_063948 [Stylosanthes scabra]|uniref:F-box domain-containing protein n=1 Tax=Stylosanthes scabra TaxID=79078 RepID=A0ABU6SN07_9FABA|nr:hypothetical protein [Stylosanthes scabra]
MADNNNRSFNDILPVDLIRGIFLRVPTRHLARLRCVSKLWNTLISDPNFTKSHFELSLQPPSHTCIFIPNDSTHYYRSIDIHALSQAPNAHAFHSFVPVPTLFIALSHKRISCHHIPKFSTLARRCFSHFRSDFLSGFGYDISRDDYFVLLGWFDHHTIEDGERFEFFSLRSNSWQSLDDAVNAIPHQLRRREQWVPSMFFNGAIHWLHHGFDMDQISLFIQRVSKEGSSSCSRRRKVIQDQESINLDT